MSSSILMLISFAALLVLLFAGVHIVFIVGGLGVLGTLVVAGPSGLGSIVSTLFNQFNSFTPLAVPCFMFLGILLERSGIAEESYDLMYKLLAPVPGGLAVATIFVCAIFGAMTGTAAAATVCMGVIALPAMLKRNYNRSMAIGCIAAGGTLGPIIPPSLIMIMFGIYTNVSIGRLFAGGVFTGIFIAILFSIYVIIRALINKDFAPAIPKEERPHIKEILKAAKGVIAPIVIIVLILGTIFTGIATPTEAAAIGCAGTFICIVLRRGMTWKLFKETCHKTIEMSSMVCWIMFSSACFSAFFARVGVTDIVNAFVMSLTLPPGLIVGAIILLYLILGCFLDPAVIVMLTITIVYPVVVSLGFDPVWFGVVLSIALVIGYITPPFGFNLFYMKRVVPSDVSMGEIYKSVVPFIILMVISLIVFYFVPELATWLPTKIYG